MKRGPKGTLAALALGFGLLLGPAAGQDESSSVPVQPALPDRFEDVQPAPRRAPAQKRRPLRPPAEPFEGDPFGEMERMHERMMKMMQEMFDERRLAPFDMPRGFDAGSIQQPDLSDEGDHYTFTMDLPGMDKSSIKLKVQPRGLTVEASRKGRRQAKGAEALSASTVRRSMSLPSEVDPARARADYKDGVLTITLPKARPGQRAPATEPPAGPTTTI